MAMTTTVDTSRNINRDVSTACGAAAKTVMVIKSGLGLHTLVILMLGKRGRTKGIIHSASGNTPLSSQSELQVLILLLHSASRKFKVICDYIVTLSYKGQRTTRRSQLFPSTKYMNISLCVPHVYGVPWTEECIGCPGTGVTGSCELLNMGIGNRTQTAYKSSEYS
ncbi:hypothetical protein STEG23_028313 [Scotinomys teguina]